MQGRKKRMVWILQQAENNQKIKRFECVLVVFSGSFLSTKRWLNLFDVMQSSCRTTANKDVCLLVPCSHGSAAICRVN